MTKRRYNSGNEMVHLKICTQPAMNLRRSNLDLPHCLGGLASSQWCNSVVALHPLTSSKWCNPVIQVLSFAGLFR